jgi:hypothetical protein
LAELVTEVDLVVFDLTAAKLQIEMTALFAHELADRETSSQLERTECMTDGAIGCLHTSSCQTIRRALARLTSIRQKLGSLTESQGKLIEASHSLRPIYLTGKIEMADGAGARLETVFRDVGGQLEETEQNLGGLRTLLEDLQAHLIRGLAHGEQVETTISHIDARIGSAFLG